MDEIDKEVAKQKHKVGILQRAWVEIWRCCDIDTVLACVEDHAREGLKAMNNE